MSYPEFIFNFLYPCDFKSNKLDYLQGPNKEFFIDNFFIIGQTPWNAGKLNWNLLCFFIQIHFRGHLTTTSTNFDPILTQF